jgi:hypothetical protein
MKRYYIVYTTGKLEEVRAKDYAQHLQNINLGFGSAAYAIEEAEDFSLEETNEQ